MGPSCPGTRRGGGSPRRALPALAAGPAGAHDRRGDAQQLHERDLHSARQRGLPGGGARAAAEVARKLRGASEAGLPGSIKSLSLDALLSFPRQGWAVPVRCLGGQAGSYAATDGDPPSVRCGSFLPAPWQLRACTLVGNVPMGFAEHPIDFPGGLQGCGGFAADSAAGFHRRSAAPLRPFLPLQGSLSVRPCSMRVHMSAVSATLRVHSLARDDACLCVHRLAESDGFDMNDCDDDDDNCAVMSASLGQQSQGGGGAAGGAAAAPEGSNSIGGAASHMAGGRPAAAEAQMLAGAEAPPAAVDAWGDQLTTD